MDVEFGNKHDVIKGWKGYDGRELPPPVVPVTESKEVVKSWKPLSSDEKPASPAKEVIDIPPENETEKPQVEDTESNQGESETWWDLERK